MPVGGRYGGYGFIAICPIRSGCSEGDVYIAAIRMMLRRLDLSQAVVNF